MSDFLAHRRAGPGLAFSGGQDATPERTARMHEPHAARPGLRGGVERHPAPEALLDRCAVFPVAQAVDAAAIAFDLARHVVGPE